MNVLIYLAILFVLAVPSVALAQGAPAPWLGQVDAICIELHDWFKAGCSRSFFAAVEDFSVEAWRGENVLVARP